MGVTSNDDELQRESDMKVKAFVRQTTYCYLMFMIANLSIAEKENFIKLNKAYFQNNSDLFRKRSSKMNL
jgi:hypothetical protein